MAYTPIRNPLYIDATPWPYLKGPNYTRPVFKEHTRQGNFVRQPVMVMPALSGLGKVEIPAGCWDSPGFKASHDNCLVEAQKKCDFAEPCTTQEHEGCLTKLVAASPCGKPATVLPSVGSGPWYTNPYNLALAAAVGVVMFSLLGSNDR